MRFQTTLATAVIMLSACAAQAQDSAIILGKSTYAKTCAVCHGEDGKGDGSVAELFQVKPKDLTQLSKRADGKFPFSDVYRVIVLGMEAPGHGTSAMPVWGDEFMADALEDRGVSKNDAINIAAGRALSLAYYLETIQE